MVGIDSDVVEDDMELYKIIIDIVNCVVYFYFC